MTWETERSNALDVIFDHFSVAVTHVESGATFRGIYKVEFIDEDGVRIIDVKFTCKTSEIPVPLRIGDKITDGTYTDRIVTIDDNREGKTKMLLERTQ